MQEYAVASAVLFAMLETAACETSQRVTAMDNASTNAKDMVDSFKLLYNRARQAKARGTGGVRTCDHAFISSRAHPARPPTRARPQVTTELGEIISGSESLAQATVSD